MGIDSKLKEIVRVGTLRILGERAFKNARLGYWVRRIKNGSFYEEEMNALKLFVHEGDAGLDMGANFGQYAYALSRIVGERGSVFCFEPSAYTAGILKDVTERLRLSNVVIEKSALGDSVGSLHFVIPIEKDSSIPNVATAHIKANGETNIGSEEVVSVTTLDKYFEGKNIRNVSFVKCDVEGAELMILKGGKEFLLTHKPAVLCEIVEKYEERYNCNSKDVLDFMGKLGYKMFIYEKTDVGGVLKPIDSIKEGIINYFFIHQ
jgi:FkbM family methyltransferase